MLRGWQQKSPTSGHFVANSHHFWHAPRGKTKNKKINPWTSDSIVNLRNYLHLVSLWDFSSGEIKGFEVHEKLDNWGTWNLLSPLPRLPRRFFRKATIALKWTLTSPVAILLIYLSIPGHIWPTFAHKSDFKKRIIFNSTKFPARVPPTSLRCQLPYSHHFWQVSRDSTENTIRNPWTTGSIVHLRIYLHLVSLWDLSSGEIKGFETHEIEELGHLKFAKSPASSPKTIFSKSHHRFKVNPNIASGHIIDIFIDSRPHLTNIRLLERL